MYISANLPGTVLLLAPQNPSNAFDALRPLFAVSPGGLLLSQITEMTGLGASTIQNWVKRGWVPRPEGKKYGEVHVARILLINLLRPCMQLEEMIDLLRYINGRVGDETDDIIPEPQLYNLLCSAIFELESGSNLSPQSISELTESKLVGYVSAIPDAHKRLRTALNIMLLNVSASALMQSAKTMYKNSILHE